MTHTYFIRHSSALDVDASTLEDLWAADRIAIHFPRDESGTFVNGDSRSLNPADYGGHSKSVMQRFLGLARDGGYVFATYRGKQGGKVGYVTPGSSPELFPGFWGSKNNHKGREATLKSLPLSQVRNLRADEAISLVAVQPRQGTFCRWRKIGGIVIALTNGGLARELVSLTPNLQEIMCMEYLRTEDARRRGLPVLRQTLMPVGRTMKDIDIFGVSESGNVLFAQVTYKSLNDSGSKLRKLDSYRSQGNETIFFCQCDQRTEINGHMIFGLQQVFDDFCINSEEGREWFRLATVGSLPAATDGSPAVEP